jgi:hypothetical protein
MRLIIIKDCSFEQNLKTILRWLCVAHVNKKSERYCLWAPEVSQTVHLWAPVHLCWSVYSVSHFILSHEDEDRIQSLKNRVLNERQDDGYCPELW